MKTNRSILIAIATLAICVLWARGPSAQDLPSPAIDSFPPVSREPIARALTDVRADSTDAARVGRLGMLLHAWEQFDAAAEAYASFAREHPRLVTEGRDQGSVVFPDADVKFYLDASATIRAQRRGL